MRHRAYIRIGTSTWRRGTALALLALLLMPITYRAGAAYPHGHALIQLVHEAQHAAPAHRHGFDQASHSEHLADVASAHAGTPAIQVVVIAAVPPASLAGMFSPAGRAAPRPTSDTPSWLWLTPPPHPPPREDASRNVTS